MKFAEEDLSKIKELQNSYSEIIKKIGQVELQIADVNSVLNELEQTKNRFLNEYREAKESEKTLVAEFTKKYGEGNLDLNTGEFTQNSVESKV